MDSQAFSVLPDQHPASRSPLTEDAARLVHSPLVDWFPLLGFALGCMVWLLDAVIDLFLIAPDGELLEAFWPDEPGEFWMRSLVVVVITGVSFLARFLMRRQQRVEIQLLHHQENLEQLVAERTRELERLASCDPLTQLYNRRKLCEIMDNEMQRAVRYAQPLSLIICDIDYFKRINDTWGHDEGDRVLKQVAAILCNDLRQTDVCARWGGEEFMILLPHTALPEARLIAEKLREGLGGIVFGAAGETLSASFGVSQLKADEQTTPLVKRADEALYQAKREGRDRVCVHP